MEAGVLGVPPLVVAGLVLGIAFVYAFIKIVLPMMGVKL
jgi:hypothetical protein